MSKRFILLAALLTSAMPCLMQPASAQSYQYLITDLGTLSGPMSTAGNLNNSGQAVGMSVLANANFHGVLWNGGATDLGTLAPDSQSHAFAVNDVAQVVGVSYSFGDLIPHAFLWQAGTRTPLGNFAPRDINAAGVVVGHQTLFINNLWVDHACRWTAGTLADLSTLGGANSDAAAVDASARVVGHSFLADDLTVRACLWLNGTPHDLGTLLGTATAKSAAADINSAGQIVGWSDAASGQVHAFRSQIDAAGNVTQRTDLGVLGNGFSYAFGINAGGVIVGSSNSHAFIWSSGVLTDLNALIPPGAGWTLTRASAINDGGQIVGEAWRFGFQRAFLLTPVTCLKGDVNGDGQIDGRDIQAFINVLLNGGPPREICAGDLASVQDGWVTNADVQSFVSCLLGSQPCG